MTNLRPPLQNVYVYVYVCVCVCVCARRHVRMDVFRFVWVRVFVCRCIYMCKYASAGVVDSLVTISGVSVDLQCLLDLCD